MNKPPVKFLLVDDRDENLVALEALLRRDGLECLQAHSGEAALELLLKHDVALAFIDVHMPGMDGFELAELMRGAERTRAVPIIFVTASQQEQHRVFQGYDAGAVDFLIKPIEPRVLKHKADTFFRLHEQRLELAETLRLNETFVSAVGHDLKNPLNAIVMSADLLLNDAKDDRTKSIATRLRSSGRRMAQMIDDLFDLSRARLGNGIPITVEAHDLAVIARRVIAEIETVNPTRAISLDVTGNTQGKWDGTRLAQVISNLVANAIRHGASGTPVDVRVYEKDDRMCIEVHNAGAIEPSLLPHIFDPFRSNESKRSRADGLGLGLYIVHQIVTAHAGTIEVRSTSEDGTTFVAGLPREARSTPNQTAPI